MTGPVSGFEIAKNLKPQAVQQAPVAAASVAVAPETRAVIDDVFERIKACYPAWKQSWPTTVELGAAKREWLAEFIAAGITGLEQIRHGVRMARKDPSPFPCSPGVFVAWCFEPEGLGLPAVEKAYSQAMRNTHVAQVADARWSSPAIYHAAVGAGFHSLQNLSRELGLKRFEKHYLVQCKKLWRGEVLAPAPVAALPNPAKACSPEVGRAALEALRGICRG